jgi:hypothetical protein
MPDKQTFLVGESAESNVTLAMLRAAFRGCQCAAKNRSAHLDAGTLSRYDSAPFATAMRQRLRQRLLGVPANVIQLAGSEAVRPIPLGSVR